MHDGSRATRRPAGPTAATCIRIAGAATPVTAAAAAGVRAISGLADAERIARHLVATDCGRTAVHGVSADESSTRTAVDLVAGAASATCHEDA